MRSIPLLAVSAFICISAFSQINPNDSTVQVVAFWDVNEKQTYAVSFADIQVIKNDTVSKDITEYDVEITVKDSTSDSYIIEWRYTNYRVKTRYKISEGLMSIRDGMKILIKTDEFGSVKEIVNWAEVRDYIKTGAARLKKDLKNVPELVAMIGEVEKSYATKALVEEKFEDAQQLFNFHGSKFKLGEVLEGKLQSPNPYGSEPIATDVTFTLDEIDFEDFDYVLRSTTTVNAEQLAQASFAYLKAESKTTGVEVTMDHFKDLKNETVAASRIHESGWVLYSISTLTVTANLVSNIEERMLQLK